MTDREAFEKLVYAIFGWILSIAIGYLAFRLFRRWEVWVMSSWFYFQLMHRHNFRVLDTKNKRK